MPLPSEIQAVGSIMLVCIVPVPYGIVAYKYDSNFQLLVSKKFVMSEECCYLILRYCVDLS